MTDYVDRQLGNYRLVRHLGRGAFGDVYLGIHVHLKTPAAIKVLHTELTSNDVEKFRTEARTIARLEHPHMVRVLDFGIENYTPYLVMSYAPNGTLRQRHPKGTIIPLATIISYVSQVADALQYVHQQKLIHRDIKPENMLLGRYNEVLLSDFGFVQIAPSSISQSTKEMAGTIPYMAPEQFNGKPRPASDQYSLGIVVYEWLIGSRPFQGSVLEIVTQHMQSPPPPLHAVNPDIPSEVEEVVFTALAKEPHQRFATVLAFANALQQASNVVAPIASASTLSFEEMSALPSIGTQPLSAVMTPVEFPRYTAPASHAHAQEDSDPNTNSSNHQHMINLPAASNTHPRRRISRRAVLFGLAGVAIGSAVSNGLWIAKSAGVFESKTLTHLTPATTPILPLPGTTLYTFTGHTGSVLSAAWSPDGYRIASGSADNTVKVWDATTGWHEFTYPGHKDWVWSVAWSPDGNYIASGGGSYDRTVQVWNVATKQPVDIFNSTDGVNSAVWSPDGKFIALGSYDKSVLVRDPFNQITQFTLSGHTGGVKSVAWSPNGKFIASGSFDQTVKVWDALTGNLLYTLLHDNYVKSVTWSPDSKYIASSTGDTGSQGNGEHLVYVWNATTRKLLHRYYGHNDEVSTVSWSPDGKLIASASGNLNSGKGDTSVQVWDAFSGNKFLTYSGHHKMVNSIAWASEGSLIASASWDMTVQVWKAE
jgi:eukaryotic-like serine/threonine-protein kinase